MKADFLDLFEHLQYTDVMENDLYEIIEEAHTLIKTKNKNSVPNTLRKFYECILHRCEKEGIKVVRKPARRTIKEKTQGINKNKTYIDLNSTTDIIFAKEPEFNRKIIQPFLDIVNEYSHCQDASYATIKNNEINKLIEYAINIWNWYAKKIQNLDDKYLITAKKFDLPEAQDYNVLESKIESKSNEIKVLKEQLAQTSSEIKEPEETIIEEQTEEDEPLDILLLEQDILQTINEFISDNIYCTHKTIALFLLGDRIPQTEFKKLTERELFGKYSKNKFSVFEYDMALQNLVNEEKIIQIDAYYHPFDKKMTIFDKLRINLKTKLYRITSRYKKHKTKINKRNLEIIQKAIDEEKNIELKYYKTIPNTNKKEMKIRHLKPVKMVPKENKDDIINPENKTKYTPESLYYLKAYDLDDENNKDTKNFRLDNIKSPKILNQTS